MKRKRVFDAHYLKHGKWWVAWSDDVPGALTQGRTLEEARENLKDAIALMLEDIGPDDIPEKPGHLVRETVTL